MSMPPGWEAYKTDSGEVVSVASWPFMVAPAPIFNWSIFKSVYTGVFLQSGDW